MHTILDSAFTWFLESIIQRSDGGVTIRLAEGIKGLERQSLPVGKREGFPVEVLPQSRCARIVFEEVLEFLIYRESFYRPDPTLRLDEGRFLHVVGSSPFRDFAESTTSIRDIHPVPYQEYYLWCEDQILHILTSEPPEILFEEGGPDMNVERVGTWIVE